MLVFRNPHFVWMAPVALVVLYVGMVCLWWVLSRKVSSLAQPRVLAGLLVFMTTLSLLSIPGWLHDLAAVLLAAGITPHITWLVMRRREITERVVWRSLPALVGAVVLLIAVATGAPVVKETLALRQLPAAPSGAPNVLFIILDTVRGGSLSLLGYKDRTTPNLEQLGQRGIVFERAVAPSPWTLPTHASVLTGRPPHELSANFNVPLDDTYPTLAEVLSQNGYATGGFVANQFNADYEHGISRGFAHWEDYPVTLGQIAYNSALIRRFVYDGRQGRQNSRLLQALGLELRIGEKNADRINADALRWMSKHDDRPTFTFLNYFDAHYPYAAPPSLPGQEPTAAASRWSFRARVHRAFRGGRQRGVSVEDERELQRAYEAEIAALDAQVGDLLREMESEGALDNTLVVVSSDHGEEFGEHGKYEHGNDVFMTQVHVPLIISFPRRLPSGARIDAPVGIRHLAATILDLTGVADSAALPGRTLAVLWAGAPGNVGNPLSVLEKRNELHASLVTPTHHYIYANGTEHLYDYRSDPAELRDLAGDPWAPDTLRRLRRELIARLASEAPERLRALQSR